MEPFKTWGSSGGGSAFVEPFKTWASSDLVMFLFHEDPGLRGVARVLRGAALEVGTASPSQRS